MPTAIRTVMQYLLADEDIHVHVHVNIYPPELTLKRTTESDTTLSYLDVSISICKGKFITDVFDKRDNFNFNIVNYPYMCSNIPTKSTYGVYISQLIRISRICDKFASFVNFLSSLFTLCYFFLSFYI